MEIQVLMERLASGGYRARVARFPVVAHGATQEEALSQVREALAAYLRARGKSDSFDLEPTDNPWLAIAGMHDPNDPIIQEWKEIMAENRRREDQVPEAS